MEQTQISPEIMARNAGAAADLLRALANEHRLMVLCQLVAGERNVTQLCEACPVSQSALSQHLAKLRAQGLVRTRREGQTIWYAIADPSAARIIRTLAEIFCPEALT
ncbi:MAG: helix-turn-helix transcriptional regulator [Alphaproteobacteria bacterium]|nr:transcriptional regulator [Hyphomonas sp.]MBR9807939.1 helix-turn-helix transcriptional regulator [Alphaproteobacteria bacterium]|tara:strand:+ start:1338 stop:1658 length:321 start_codon:yes stop_codon:yes gene_type:complete